MAGSVSVGVAPRLDSPPRKVWISCQHVRRFPPRQKSPNLPPTCPQVFFPPRKVQISRQHTHRGFVFPRKVQISRQHACRVFFSPRKVWISRQHAACHLPLAAYRLAASKVAGFAYRDLAASKTVGLCLPLTARGNNKHVWL